MDTRVVFHVDWEKEKCLNMALNNMTNLLKRVPFKEASICLLANGTAVKLFQRDHALQYTSDIHNLSRKGVRFLMCSNSLDNLGISREVLLESCEVVEAGIIELIRLQAEGYAYIKP